MGLLSFARNKSFWLFDLIKGGHIKTAYDEIKKIDKMDSDSSFISEYQHQAWENLKRIACSNTKAYAPYEALNFAQFPVISKQDIRQRQDDYLSWNFSKDSLIQMATSGSTGTPFICYQNGLKKRRVNAEIIYYSEKVGYRLGDNLSYIRNIVKKNKKSVLKQFMQNQTLINCGKLSDSGIEILIKTLQKQSKKGPVTLLAYASTYTAIKDFCVKNNINQIDKCNIVGAISGSDMLWDETRNFVSQVFGNIPCVSRYSNEENGVLGQDEGINNVFSINEANYIVEVLDENGMPCPDGMLGRIVVTDLFNYAMPMIRYDTGDIGAIKTFDIGGRKKKCICEFSGRRVDVIFDEYGNALSPHVITNTMWDFPNIIQFQLVQIEKGEYILKLNVDQRFHQEVDVVQSLRRVLGETASIHVQKVDEVPVLASGKRRYIVNEWVK